VIVVFTKLDKLVEVAFGDIMAKEPQSFRGPNDQEFIKKVQKATMDKFNSTILDRWENEIESIRGELVKVAKVSISDNGDNSFYLG
jgi:hypothetical protein